MIFSKNNYLPIEKIKGKIELQKNVPNGLYKIECNLAKVYDWYDESIKVLGEGIVENNILNFQLNNGLKKGLYTLLNIEDSNNFNIGDKNDTKHSLGAFLILGNENKNPLELYRSIYNMREINFNKFKGKLDDENTIIYHAFIFCKNILVSTCAQYDDVQIFPYDYLKCTSQVNYINSFFEKKILTQLKVKEESFDKSIPSSVFMITNIKATSYEEAEKYALDKVDILNNIFSLLLRSHGEYFATVVLNTNDHMSKINMYETRYKGNLLLFADQGFNVLHYYKYISKNNSYLKVYLKLLNDAIKEEDRMMRYYRYWNILEGLALHKRYNNNPMKKWNGDIVKNKKGDEVKIGSESLNIVYEFIRENFGNISENKFINDLEQIKNVKSFLSICYQRRCCCAHQGECYKDDGTICTNKNSEKNCRENNIIHYDQPLGFQDKILRKLEDITFQTLLAEINAYSGKYTKESNFVEKIMI